MHQGLFTKFQQTNYFTSLDGLRFLCILPVIFQHSINFDNDHPRILELGFLGVDFFFVISGFLIVTLILREKDSTNDISLKKFYMRRTLRIFPLYYGVILGYLVFYGFVSKNSELGQQFLSEIWVYLTYTANFFPVTFDVVWSLATEEQFYLIWPALEKYFKKWILPILFVLLLINQMINFPEGREWLQANWGVVVPNLSIMNVTCTPILLGVLIAHMLNNKTSFEILAFITAYRVMPFIYLAVLVFFMVTAPVDISGITRLLIQITMALLLVSCVVRQDHFLEFFLSFKPVQYIGSISYGMYLFHIICLAVAFKVLDIYGLGKEWPVFFLGTTLTIIVAGLSFKFYEKPFLNLKKRFSVL